MITEEDVFGTTAVRDGVLKKTGYNAKISALYDATSILSLDIFEDRYDIFYLPKSFTKESKKTLQKALCDFEYAHTQFSDRGYIFKVFKKFEAAHGTDATSSILEWIHNASDGQLSYMVSGFFDLSRSLRLGKIKTAPPVRLERFFSFLALLREAYFLTDASQYLDPSWLETTWDKKLYKSYDSMYFDEMENLYDPGYAANTFDECLHAKISWENICAGNKPEQEELQQMFEWAHRYEKRNFKSAEDFQRLYLTPGLRADYVKRGLIKE